MVDADADQDGMADCKDKCPFGMKTEPGVCGCGTKDMDLDKDGVLDCKDLCPSDAAGIEPVCADVVDHIWTRTKIKLPTALINARTI